MKLTHDRYTNIVTTLDAQPSSSPALFKTRRQRPLRERWTARIVVGFVLTMVAMMTFVQQAPAAEAGFWDPLKSFVCGDSEHSMTPASHVGGIRALGMGKTFTQSLGYEDKGSTAEFEAFRHTAYEKYGMSGATFTTYNGLQGDVPNGRAGEVDKDPRQEEWACFPFGKIAPTSLANVLFDGTKTITGLGLWIYGQALNPTWANDILDGAETMITGSKNVTGLREGLYFNMMTLVIMSSAIYLLVLVFKRSFMRVWTNFLWLAGSLAVGAALMYQPKFLPNLGQAVVTEITTGIHNTTTGAVMGKAGTSKDGNACYVGKIGKPPKGKASTQTLQNVRTIECSMWSVFVYAPWVAGQFGQPSSEAASIASGGGDGRATVADATGYPVLLGGGATIKNNFPLRQLDLQSLDARDETLQGDARGDNIAAWGHLADEVVLDHTKLTDAWVGNTGFDRISIATLSLVAAGAGLLIIVVLSGSLLLYKVGIILLVALSPFFFLLGAHSGFGRSITMKWLSMFAGFYLKSAFASLFLGIAMFFYAIITQLGASGEMDYGTSILALIILSIAMLIYRKPLTDMATSFQIPGGGEQAIASTDRAVATGTRKVGVGTVSLAARAMTGGKGSARLAPKNKTTTSSRMPAPTPTPKVKPTPVPVPPPGDTPPKDKPAPTPPPPGDTPPNEKPVHTPPPPGDTPEEKPSENRAATPPPSEDNPAPKVTPNEATANEAKTPDTQPIPKTQPSSKVRPKNETLEALKAAHPQERGTQPLPTSKPGEPSSTTRVKPSGKPVTPGAKKPVKAEGTAGTAGTPEKESEKPAAPSKQSSSPRVKPTARPVRPQAPKKE